MWFYSIKFTLIMYAKEVLHHINVVCFLFVLSQFLFNYFRPQYLRIFSVLTGPTSVSFEFRLIQEGDRKYRSSNSYNRASRLFYVNVYFRIYTFRFKKNQTSMQIAYSSLSIQTVWHRRCLVNPLTLRKLLSIKCSVLWAVYMV